MSRKIVKKIILVLIVMGLSGFGVTLGVIATTKPELITLVEKIAEYGLKGYVEFLKFLLDLFKEAVKCL